MGPAFGQVHNENLDLTTEPKDVNIFASGQKRIVCSWVQKIGDVEVFSTIKNKPSTLNRDKKKIGLVASQKPVRPYPSQVQGYQTKNVSFEDRVLGMPACLGLSKEVYPQT